MKTVFLDRATIAENIDFNNIRQVTGELEFYPVTRKSEVFERARFAEVILTNKVELDAACLTKLPKLKLICITATGTNNVDLVAAKKHGIAVCNVSGYSTPSVAQHVFSYLLNVTSNVEFYLKNNQIKPWHQSNLFCQIDAPINELSGQSIGIVGYGNLGKTVAKIAEAFSMNVIVSERPGTSQTRKGRVKFEEMLTIADIVSLHCPLNAETHSLFNQDVFNQMKKGSIFINTARGPIVDSAALADVLKSGHLAHAIIDVLENEPPESNHPLLSADIPNLTLTHHIAWGSMQAQQRLIDNVAENISAFQSGKMLNRVEL